MGCDAYADDEGNFCMWIKLYDRGGKIMHVVDLKGLRARERIDTELIKGDWR